MSPVLRRLLVVAAALGVAATGTPAAAAAPDQAAELKVMSFNLWHGGSQVNDYRAKQVAFIQDSGADVVTLQESSATSAKELAEALGWDYLQADADRGIISRYEIVDDTQQPSNAGFGVHIELDSGQRVAVWNAHLGYDPYGPYDACFDNMPVDRILEREAESGRTGQITDILADMKDDLDNADQTPVMLTGDFNAPSHLDWTAATADSHCGYADIPWPTSVKPEEAGLVDSFRQANPDPAAVPGNTWSPVYPKHDGSTGADEPQDRIDYILYKGGLSVADSQALVVGEPKPVPDHADNEWTSDHAAVLTTFGLG
ncbi:MAG: endonuclease/exonuclease/phosphatase family protein [Stackebrandtia sp.]